MRRSYWLRVLFCMVVVGAILPLGTTLAAMQPATPVAMTIADPRVDPDGALRDALSIAQATAPVAGPLEATGDAESNVPLYLSSGVQLEQFYARYSFEAPATPNGNWMVGFTFWDDGHGNYYDLSVIVDPGEIIWGLGVTSAYQYDVHQTGTVADAQSFDTTPGSVNTVSLIFYDKVAILVANDSRILANVDLGLSGTGNVRAKVGWGAHGGTPVPPQPFSVSDFSVWTLPVDGVLPAGTPVQTGPTPGPAPVQTPGVFVSNRDQATPPDSTQGSMPTPTTVPTAGANQIALLTAIFEKERSAALAHAPLWTEGGYGLVQSGEDIFHVEETDSIVTDCYVVATFANPSDMSTPSDYAIGIRDNYDNREIRFIVDSNGQWAVELGNAAPFATGTTTVDATPGAEITLEVIAKGATGMLAVTGQVVAQVDLSANLNGGHVYIASGTRTDTRIPGRTVSYPRFEVYALAS